MRELIRDTASDLAVEARHYHFRWKPYVMELAWLGCHAHGGTTSVRFWYRDSSVDAHDPVMERGAPGGWAVVAGGAGSERRPASGGRINGTGSGLVMGTAMRTVPRLKARTAGGLGTSPGPSISAGLATPFRLSRTEVGPFARSIVRWFTMGCGWRVLSREISPPFPHAVAAYWWEDGDGVGTYVWQREERVRR